MSNQVNSMNKGLTVKDLVTTGIFTALLFVFVLVGGVFLGVRTVTWTAAYAASPNRLLRLSIVS